MKTRSEQKELTRARLVRVAAELFARKGFVETTTARVAVAAKVSHGTVFVHFPTREALLDAVIGDFARQLADRLRAEAEGGATVREVLAAHLAGLREHEGLYTRLVMEKDFLPRRSRSGLVGIQSAIGTQLALAAERDRSIRKMPQHLLFNTWLGLLHHYLCNRDLFAPDGSVIERHGETLLDHFMSLIEKGTRR